MLWLPTATNDIILSDNHRIVAPRRLRLQPRLSKWSKLFENDFKDFIVVFLLMLEVLMLTIERWINIY